jgi:hypothetical protein
MNWKKIKEKYFVFLFSVYVSFTISFLVGLLFINEFLELYNAIYLNFVIYLIINNIDLKDKGLLDEYLYLICIAITWGLFLSDISDYIIFLQQVNIVSYIAIILVCVFITTLLNNIIRNLLLSKKKSYYEIKF